MAWKANMDKILVDNSTKILSQDKIKYKFEEAVKFKGKSYKLPIYEPIDPSVLYNQLISLNFRLILRVHAHPYVIDKEDEYNLSRIRQFGRESELDSAIKEIIDYANTPGRSLIITIEGPPGSGKTLFARGIIDGLKDAEENRGDEKETKIPRYYSDEKLCKSSLFAGTLNSATTNLYFNIWRLVLAKVFILLYIYIYIIYT